MYAVQVGPPQTFHTGSDGGSADKIASDMQLDSASDEQPRQGLETLIVERCDHCSHGVAQLPQCSSSAGLNGSNAPPSSQSMTSSPKHEAIAINVLSDDMGEGSGRDMSRSPRCAGEADQPCRSREATLREGVP